MIRLPTPFGLDLDVRPAGVGDRIVAWIFDALIGTAYVLLVFGLFIGVLLGDVLGDGAVLTAAYVIAVAPLAFYHLVCEVYFDGQSIGKRMRDIRVVTLDGGAPTLGGYVMRWLFRPLDISIYGAVAITSIAVTARGQRLGDLAAGTTVVKRAASPTLDKTSYQPVPADYVVRYPGAERLTDRDVETVKAVLSRLRAEGRSTETARLARRARKAVQRAARIGQVDEPDEPFLRRVVLDYNALLDRYDVAIESQAVRGTSRVPSRR
jgi:uncharacterized RDD family membrane protein YckC